MTASHYCHVADVSFAHAYIGLIEICLNDDLDELGMGFYRAKIGSLKLTDCQIDHRLRTSICSTLVYEALCNATNKITVTITISLV